LETIPADFRCFYCSSDDHGADSCPMSEEDKRRVIYGAEALAAARECARIGHRETENGCTRCGLGMAGVELRRGQRLLQGGGIGSAALAEGVFLRKKRG